jgi:NAD(P)-dependent dehydrogenase (short-subunit alcohol dehydrogenase family)
MTSPLSGTVALVTGASSGIGEQTAASLAELGADVVVAARRTDRLDALVDRITEKGGRSPSPRTSPTRTRRSQRSGRPSSGSAGSTRWWPTPA